MLKYVLIIALGAISYGMLSSFAKIAYGQGYTAAEITFMQALLGAVILWGIVILKKIRQKSKGFKINRKLLLAGTTMGASAYCYYLSVAYIPASLSIVLLMQVTWMSIFLEWIFYKKKPSFKEILATIIILLGTILAGNLYGQGDFNFSFTGIILAVASAFIYALFILLTSKIGNDVPMFEKSALMMTGSAAVIFLINAKSLTNNLHLNQGLFRWGLFLALFGTIIPPVCFTKGMPKIGAGFSSILLTLELPVAVFCAHFILKEQINFMQIVGILIILGAIIFLNLSKKKSSKLELPKEIIS